jgi:hypothetical protein
VDRTNQWKESQFQPPLEVRTVAPFISAVELCTTIPLYRQVAFLTLGGSADSGAVYLSYLGGGAVYYIPTLQVNRHVDNSWKSGQ